MKKRKIEKLTLHKKSISKLQSIKATGGFNNQEEDDRFPTFGGCTFNLACWSIGCPTDFCSVNC